MKKTITLIHWSAQRTYALCLATLLLPLVSYATSLEIDPVRLNLNAKQQTAAITIRNNSNAATTIEIKGTQWTQVDANDVYTPTRELLVFPPVVTIAAHGSQIVRAALRRQPDASHEMAYRINLAEVPPEPVAGVTGVQVALRIGLPVFVAAKNGRSAPKMQWSAMRTSDQDLTVTLKNAGSAHIQVTDFSLSVPGSDAQVATEQRSSYVLAGQSHTWTLKAPSADLLNGARLRLKVYTDAGDADQELPLDRP